MANAKKKENSQMSIVNIAGWLVLLAILIVTAVALTSGSQNPGGGDLPNGEPVGGDAAALFELGSDERVKGNLDSEITLIEYGDFQCSACAFTHPGVKQTIAEYGDQIKIVFRHLPLTSIHPNALNASYAAEAANMQGKFWEMHDILFERQNDWASSLSVKDVFVSYAEELGLDTDKFRDDMSSPIVIKKVSNDSANATALGVNSTPTFFFEGQNVGNPGTFENFSILIDSVLVIENE